MTQKELKEMYMNIIKTEVCEDEHMQNFAKKQCAYVVQFSNGDIVDIEKPSIKKDFCFGAGSLIWYDLPPVRCQSGAVSVMRYALHRSPQKADHLQLSCMEIKDGRIIPIELFTGSLGECDKTYNPNDEKNPQDRKSVV